MFIHHCNKAGDQRGTGAREDHLNASIKLTKPDNSQQHDGCCFKVTFTKARGCHGNAIEPFIAKLIQAQDNKMSWEISGNVESTKDQLLNLIRDSDANGLAATKAAEILMVSKARISKLKKQLEQEGVLQESNGKTPMKLTEKEG